ncbi:MAG: MarR family transcriptional regulator [Alphaproteobacteria bacterium]|nr:MarR family transcriptional regulator [Alphaproteobacteria bacterium]
MPRPAVDPERSLLFLLSDAARRLRRDFGRRAADLGLTRSQWQVLAHIALAEGINQAGLAERLDIEPITLVRHLDRLETQGLIERRPDPSDRRVRTLYLTPAADPVLAEIRNIAEATRRDLLRGFSPEDEARLVEDLLRMRANLAATGSAAPAGPAQTRRAGGGPP